MSSDAARSLLIVEDDLALQKQIKWSVDKFDSVTAHDRDSAMVQLRRHSPAVVTMDLGLPPDADGVSEGFRLLEQILTVEPDTKVIVLTGQNDQANALRAVALGAYDFFAKPFEPDLLNLTIERAFRMFELQKENRRLQSMYQPDALSGLITRDQQMRATQNWPRGQNGWQCRARPAPSAYGQTQAPPHWSAQKRQGPRPALSTSPGARHAARGRIRLHRRNAPPWG